jgi:16S rRNA G966 N2-methylase RsmD
MLLSDAQKLTHRPPWRLIKAHINDDPRALALAWHGRKDIAARLIIEQIACLQKARKKLPTFSEKPFLYNTHALEQASGEAAALYKSSLLHGSRAFDITGGLGIDAFFLSRNFSSLVYCERDAALCELMRHNARLRRVGNIEIREGDSIAALHKYGSDAFDWIYADPSRRSEGKRHVNLRLCSPDVVEHQNSMLRAATNVCIKCSPLLEVESVRRALRHVRECIVVSVGGECKELLLILDRQRPAECVPDMRAVVLDTDGAVQAEISRPGGAATPRQTAGAIGAYWYEPDSAIVKARLSSEAAAHYGLKFINGSVDYCTADNKAETFPGRLWPVVSVEAWNAKRLMKYFRDRNIKAANISRRDFPLSPDALRKAFSLRDGGEHHLFFTRSATGRRIMVHCSRRA